MTPKLLIEERLSFAHERFLDISKLAPLQPQNSHLWCSNSCGCGRFASLSNVSQKSLKIAQDSPFLLEKLDYE